MITLEPQELSAENFSAYGRVIEAGDKADNQMNSGTFARFDDLAQIDYAGDQQNSASDKDTEKPAISIVRSQTTTCLLYTSPSPRDLSTSRMPSSA